MTSPIYRCSKNKKMCRLEGERAPKLTANFSSRGHLFAFSTLEFEDKISLDPRVEGATVGEASFEGIFLGFIFAGTESRQLHRETGTNSRYTRRQF